MTHCCRRAWLYMYRYERYAAAMALQSGGEKWLLELLRGAEMSGKMRWDRLAKETLDRRHAMEPLSGQGCQGNWPRLPVVRNNSCEALAAARVKSVLSDSTSTWAINGWLFAITPWEIRVYKDNVAIARSEAKCIVQRILGAYMPTVTIASLRYRAPAEIGELFQRRLPWFLKYKRLN